MAIRLAQPIRTPDAKTEEAVSAVRRAVNEAIVEFQKYAQLAAVGVFTADQGSALVSLVDGVNISTDAAKGNVFQVTLAGNRTLINPTNLIPGHTYLWIVKQDGTGNRTLAFGDKFLFPGGTAPTLTTTAGATDLIVAVVDASGDLLCVANYEFS